LEVEDMMQGQPIFILKEGTQREQGKGATHNNIQAAKAVAEAIRTTLGPRGMDKMLVDSMGDVIITNDGVTILKEIDIEHPAAKMIVEVAKTQDEECGDGTTTAVILSGEILKRSEDLIEQNVHPTIITQGYKLAAEKAVEVLNKISDRVGKGDRNTMINIAETAMTGKMAGNIKSQLADIAVDSVMSVMEERGKDIVVDKDQIKVEKKTGGSSTDTSLIEGVILDKERVHSGMPALVKNAKIALLDAAMEIKKTEVDARITITDPNQLQAFLQEEENMLKEMVAKVKKAGANVLICQKGIDDLAQHYLSKNGVYAVRRAKKSDMEKLAKATGARVVSNLDDLSKGDLGKAGKVEEKSVAGDKMTFVMECKEAKSVSVLIRGATEHVVDEVERALNDALGVVAVALEDGKVTAGGGSTSIEIAHALRKYGNDVGGREQMAIEAFAAAVEIIPRTLAENAGLDSINTLIDLRKAHLDGKKHAGINVFTGKIIDMKRQHVLEPLRVSTQAIQSATETAIMILRIDDIIASKGGGPPPMPPGGGMPPGMGGMPEM
jgi:thermosome